MSFGLDVRGVEALRVNLQKMERDARRRLIREASHTAAVDLQARIVENINSGPATGRPRGDGSRGSAAGEYPMADTNTLASMVDVDRTPHGASVVSRAEYSKALEYKPASRGGRPFMSRALNENKQRIHDVVNWAAVRLFGV